MRTTSPYFSPNRAIAPRRSGLLEGGGDRADRIARGDLRVDGVLDVAQLLRAERAGVAEVEAQLVGADVGAGLADVGAETLAQRRVQQVGGGVVALGGAPRRVIDAREHGLAPRCSVPCSTHDVERLVVAEPEHALRRAPGSRPSAHSITPASETWPPPAGIERRVGELDEEVALGCAATAPTVVGCSSVS